MPNDNTILDYHETWGTLSCLHCGCIVRDMLANPPFCSELCAEEYLADRFDFLLRYGSDICQ